MKKTDNFDALKDKVIQWAKDRKIIQNGRSEIQLLKAFSLKRSFRAMVKKGLSYE